jgi:hypothetical protein
LTFYDTIINSPLKNSERWRKSPGDYEMALLLNPKNYNQEWSKEKMKNIMLTTIEFFEKKV